MKNYTISDILRKTRTSQRVNESRIAVHFGDRTITYEELDDRSDRLATGLLLEGFRKGDRVAVMMHNRPEWIEIFFALAKLGGVLVPVNHLLREREIEHIISDSGATWVIAEDRFWALFEGVRQNPVAQTYVVLDADHESALAFENVVSSGDRNIRVDVDANDLFLLQYTSGTTGRPKGAMHTHSTVLWNAFYQLPEFGVTVDDVYLITPALGWIAGFHDFAIPTLWCGGQLVLHPTGNFDAKVFAETVERHKVTTVLLVPTVLRRVLAYDDLEKHDLSSLRLILSGGEPVPVTAIHTLHERLPTCHLQQAYGMSEFPTMMLQTLVENAVKHGLEPKPEGGKLVIKAEIVHGKLALTVQDSGLGFGQAATAGTGVGLANIRERLQLLYGTKAGLTIGENPGGGTRVTLSVPYKPVGKAHG